VGFDRGEEVSPFPFASFPAACGVGGEGAGGFFERRVERRGERRERADDKCLMRRLLPRASKRRGQPRVFAVVALRLEQFRLFAPSGDVVAGEGDGDAFAVEAAAPEQVAGAARLDLQPCAGNAGNAVQTRPRGPRLPVVRDFHFKTSLTSEIASHLAGKLAGNNTVEHSVMLWRSQGVFCVRCERVSYNRTERKARFWRG